jgi:hypothetical protein
MQTQNSDIITNAIEDRGEDQQDVTKNIRKKHQSLMRLVHYLSLFEKIFRKPTVAEST